MFKPLDKQSNMWSVKKMLTFKNEFSACGHLKQATDSAEVIDDFKNRIQKQDFETDFKIKSVEQLRDPDHIRCQQKPGH